MNYDDLNEFLPGCMKSGAISCARKRAYSESARDCLAAISAAFDFALAFTALQLKIMNV
jgi:hypothetical protein